MAPAHIAEAGWLSHRPKYAQWLLLVAGSVILSLGLLWARFPAALLLGPMIAGIVAGTNGAGVRVPMIPYMGSQAIIGCLVASAITPSIMVTVFHDFPLFLSIVLVTVAASSLLGWIMSRWQILPGSTAAWGSSPGAATAMTVMAEAFGADPQLVAFMQYMRIVFVALTASLISRFWIDTPGASAHGIVWFPPVDAIAFLETIVLAGASVYLGRRLKTPGVTFLVPMVLGALLHGAGWMRIELPEWLLATCYALIGWRIGLGFTREILLRATSALWQILLSIIALIAFCGGIAYLLSSLMNIDPLTAYLATSPGGMDSVAIIATSSNVDISFVMALQTMRLFVVLLAGPSIARLIARHSPTAQSRPT